jgi:hypothetical protein
VLSTSEFLRRLWRLAGFECLDHAQRAKLADLLDEVRLETSDEHSARSQALIEYVNYLLVWSRAKLGDSAALRADHAARVTSAAGLIFGNWCSRCQKRGRERRRWGEPVLTGGSRLDDDPMLEDIEVLCPQCLTVVAPDLALARQLRSNERFWDVSPQEWKALEARLAGHAYLSGVRRDEGAPSKQAIRRAVDALLAEIAARDEPDRGGYLTGPHWERIRVAARVLAGYRCEACGASPDDTHHKTYSRTGRESLEDVQVLCRDCHRKEHPDWSEEPFVDVPDDGIPF